MNALQKIEQSANAAFNATALIEIIDQLSELHSENKANLGDYRAKRLEAENELFNSLGLMQSLGTPVVSFWAEYYKSCDYNRTVEAMVEGKPRQIKMKGTGGNAPAHVKAARYASQHMEKIGVNCGDVEPKYNDDGKLTHSRQSVAYAAYKEANKSDVTKTFEDAARKLAKAFRANVKAEDMDTARAIAREMVALADQYGATDDE